jgi:hypothetical protein
LVPFIALVENLSLHTKVKVMTLGAHSSWTFEVVIFTLWTYEETRVCHTVAWPFTLKSILRKKKSYENSNISPWKNYNLQKNHLKEAKTLQDIIIL